MCLKYFEDTAYLEWQTDGREVLYIKVITKNGDFGYFMFKTEYSNILMMT
jgi:hypothetical protein